MAYQQNTIVSTDPGPVLANVLDTMLIAEDWEVVDTFTPSGDYRVKVYKSNAADNACGYDWFLAVLWDITGVESYFSVLTGSTYNDSTKELGAVCVTATGSGYGVSNGPAPNGLLWGNAVLSTTALWTSEAPLVYTSGSNGRTILPSSAFGFWASISLDHFAIAYTGTIQGAVTYFTLDVDEDYDGWFNGADSDPIAAWGRSTVNSADHPTKLNKGYYGPSGSLNSSNRRTFNHVASIGTEFWSSDLPVLVGPNDLVARAFRPRVCLSLNQADGNGLTWTTTPDNQSIGYGSNTLVAAEPIVVGDGIDLWQVRGGSIGDTIEIGADVYVILGVNGLAVRVED